MRRRVRVVLLLNRPHQVLADVDRAANAERFHRLPRLRVEADEVIAAVDEDAELVAVLPRGDAAMDESLPARHRPLFVGLRVVGPQLAPRFRVECDHAVVRRAQVDDVVDHDRRVLERARRRLELRQRLLAGLPFPGELEPRDVLLVDLRQRRVLHAALVAAVVRPLDRLRSALRRGDRRECGKTGGNSNGSSHRRARLGRGCPTNRLHIRSAAGRHRPASSPSRGRRRWPASRRPLR